MKTTHNTLGSLCLALAAGLLFTIAGASHAQQVLYTPPGSGFTWRDNANEANGVFFTVGSSNVVVSHLGYFSTNTVSGLATNHWVGIYAGTVLNGGGSTQWFTNLSILRQVNVPAGNSAYYYNNFYWVQLDPPMLLSANTGYVLAGQAYLNDGDWWEDASVSSAAQSTWNAFFVGSTSSSSRFAAYGPTTTTWPLSGKSVFTRNGLSKAYVMPMLGNLPQGPAKVLYPGPTNVFVTALQPLTLTAYTSGEDPITCQWWLNGTAIPGATSQTYTVPSAWDTNSGTYYFTATNSLGGQQSPNISVTVYTVVTNLVAAPATYGQTQTLFPGANVNFAITSVTGAPPFSFQWYVDGTPDYSAFSDTYSVYNVQSSGPSSIACVVANSYSTLTNTWNLTVVPQPTAPYPAAVLTDHPIDYWRLNEGPNNGSGNNGLVANDYLRGNASVYSNSIVAQNGYAQGLASQYGYNPATDSETSAQFGFYPSNPGTSNYIVNIPNVSFAAPTNSSGAFSVEAWTKGDATQRFSAGIVAKGAWGAEQFTLDTGGTSYSYRFTMRDSGLKVFYVTSNTNFPDGNWHHLVGVVDQANSNLCFYVDGVKVASVACTPYNGVFNSAVPVSIGTRLGNGSVGYNQQFFGNINDVAIYDYALSSDQVFNHYAAAGIGAHFVQMPPATTAINQGADLIVPATVIGTLPVSCQWYDVTTGGTPLANQTNATLTISNIQAATFNGHILSLTTRNDYGQATSQMNVTVYTKPAFTQQPPSAFTLYAGGTATWTVATAGPQPIGYTWLSNGVPIAFATNATLSLTNLQVSALYACWASNSFGSSTSSVASVAILPQPSAPYPAAVLNDRPIGYWRLNESDNGSGNNGVLANDYWGGNNGVYSNTILGQIGYAQGLSNQFGYYPATDPNEFSAQFGYYPAFNARSNYVGNIPNINFATPTNTSGNFSVEAWVNGDTNQNGLGVSGAGIVAKGAWAAEQFTLDTGGTGYAYRFTTRDAGGVFRSVGTSTNIPDGKWHHLAGVLDQTHSNLCLYVDGIKVATTSCSPSNGVLNSTVPVSIGSRLSSGGTYSQQFFGTINDVAIYSYALSPTQVAAHYQAANTPLVVTLSVQRSGANLTLGWSQGTLLQADSLDGPWSPVSGAVPPSYTVTPTGAQKFYRVQVR